MPKRDPLDLQAALGVPRWIARAPATTTHPVGLAAAIYKNSLARLDAFDGEVDALRTSGRFTKAGLNEEVARLAAGHKAELLKYKTPLAQIRRDAQKLAGQFKPAGVDTAAAGAIIAAIWGMLPGDQLEVEHHYITALETGDDMVAAAIEALPRFASHRPRPEVLAKGPRVRMERENPAVVAELDAIEEAERDLTRAIEYAESEMDRAAGIRASDVVEAAEGSDDA